MPCVHNLSLAHALSYHKDDMKKKEAKGFDYYSQEDTGIWLGKTADRLGLSNKSFSSEDYKDTMIGKFSYIDRNGQKIDVNLTKNSKNKEHHPGIEITLSAPKSVSVMAEVFKDKRVLDAHNKAINSVIEYAQNNFCYTRSSVNGKMVLEKVDNLLAIKFAHHTSRNQDPQSHAHVLIANITIDKNGKIKTAEHTIVFENERFIRELYNSELAHNLIELGYEMEWVKKINQIVPEIKNIPTEFSDLFSTRLQNALKWAEEHGIEQSNTAGMQMAILATRKAKDNSLGIDELSLDWENKIKELDINIEEFKAELYKNNEEKIKNNNIIKKEFLQTTITNTLNHLTERQSTFTREELISNIMLRGKGLYNIKEIEENILKNKELVNNKMDIGEYSKHLQTFNDRERTIWTTKTQIETENKIISSVGNGTNRFKSIIELQNIKDRTTKGTSINTKENETDKILFDDIKNSNGTKSSILFSTLNDSQKDTIDFILNNKDQFVGIQGYAGVGKTYTIKALNEILKENNITLIGLAPTLSATKTLSEEANIYTNTLQSFLSKYNGYASDRENKNNNETILKTIKNSFKNHIILVDEVSLISNKQMKELFTIAEKFNVRVILQGDEKQLDSVESGTPFHRLIENETIKYSKLDIILRQKNEAIKQVVYDVIKKDIISSFQRLKDNDNIRELRTDEQLDSKIFENLEDQLYTFNKKTQKREINQEVYEKYLKHIMENSPETIKKELTNKVVDVYKRMSQNDRNNTLIITSSNEIRAAINNKVREIIKEENIKNGIFKDIEQNSKTITIETLKQKSLTMQEKKELRNYEIGNIILFTKDNNIMKNNTTIKDKNNENLNIKKGIEYSILEIKEHEIIVAEKEEDKNKNNKQISINILKHSNSLNIYEKTDKELIINDKIKWTNTNKEENILKGGSLIIKNIENTQNIKNTEKGKEAIITLINPKTNKETILNLNDSKHKELSKHIDYDYVSTTYSSQGKTSRNIIMTLESYRPNLTTQKDFYVGLSRTKDNIAIITDNINKSVATLIGNTGEKLGAKDVEISNIKLEDNGKHIIHTTINKDSDVGIIGNSNSNNNSSKTRNIELEL